MEQKSQLEEGLRVSYEDHWGELKDTNELGKRILGSNFWILISVSFMVL